MAFYFVPYVRYPIPVSLEFGFSINDAVKDEKCRTVTCQSAEEKHSSTLARWSAVVLLRILVDWLGYYVTLHDVKRSQAVTVRVKPNLPLSLSVKVTYLTFKHV